MIISQTGPDAADATNSQARATAGRHRGAPPHDMEQPERVLPSETDEEQRVALKSGPVNQL